MFILPIHDNCAQSVPMPARTRTCPALSPARHKQVPVGSCCGQGSSGQHLELCWTLQCRLWELPACPCLLQLTGNRGPQLVAGEGSCLRDVRGQLAGARQGGSQCCRFQLAPLHHAVTRL